MRVCACSDSHLPITDKSGAKVVLFAENEELIKLLKYMFYGFLTKKT